MFELDKEAKEALLAIARGAVESQVTGSMPRAPQRRPPAFDLVPAGVFVTLHRDGALRGCIGTLQGTLSLAEATEEAARSAAVRDPRFPPVAAHELEAIDLEISVLSPLEPVHDVAEIVPGVHGLVMRRGQRSGLLLPQVATEYGWDRDEFLAHTAEKAGLAPDAWRDPGTRIEKFTAIVFSGNSL